MPGNKVLTAFTQDGSIVTDKKAYIKHDFLISDQPRMAGSAPATYKDIWLDEGRIQAATARHRVHPDICAGEPRAQRAPYSHSGQGLGGWSERHQGQERQRFRLFQTPTIYSNSRGVFLHRHGKRLVRYLPDIPDTG